ncbi:MAG: M16 family metallopeptidase [Planctomycetota bacterium]
MGAVAFGAGCLLLGLRATNSVEAAPSRLKSQQLANGAELHVFPQPGTGEMRLSAVVRAGAGFDGTTPGIAELVARMIRDQSRAEAAGIRSSVDFSNRGEQLVLSLRGPRTALSIAAPMFLKMLRSPVFDEGAMRHQVGIIAAEEKAAGADLDRVVAQYFYRALGAVRQTQRPALDAMTIADVRAFHQAHYRPDATIFLVSGEVTDTDFSALPTVFAGWQRAEGTAERMASAPEMETLLPGRTIGLVVTDGKQDVLFRVGVRQQFAADFSDFSAVKRLTPTIDKLTTVPISSFLQPAFGGCGLLFTSGSCSAADLTKTLDKVFASYERLRSSPLTAGEQVRVSDLQEEFAVADYANSRTPGTPLAGSIANDDRFSNTASVSPEALQAAATRWLAVDQLKLVVAGPASLATALEKYGVKVERLGEFVGAPTVTSTPNIKDGRELLDKVLVAAGGRERFAQLKSLGWESDEVIRVQTGELKRFVRAVVKFPDHMRLDMLNEGATEENVVCFAGRSGWQRTKAGIVDMRSDEVTQFRRSLLTSTTGFLAAADAIADKAEELPPETLDQKPVRVLRLTRDKASSAEFMIDPENFMIVNKRQVMVTPAGAVLQEERTSDFREVDGVLLPFQRVLLQDGAERRRIVTKSYTLNPTVPPDFYVRPGEQP